MGMLLLAHAMIGRFEKSTDKLLAIYICDQIGEQEQIIDWECAINITEAGEFCCAPENEVKAAWMRLKGSGFFHGLHSAMDAHMDSIPTAYKKKPISAALRKRVYERDGYRCVRCKATKNLTLDHHYPERFGGKATVDNLKTMCASCNSRKGSEIPEDKGESQDAI